MTTHLFNRKNIFFCFLIAFLFISPNVLHAEILYSQNYGYYLDLPEAFSLEQQTADEKSLFFSHTGLPVYFAIKVYDSSDYTNSTEALTDVLKQLKSQGDTSTFSWCGTDTAISEFMFNASANNRNSGWAAAISIPNKKAYVILMCYAPITKAAQCSQFILSVLDSFILDRSYFTKPGLVTAFAYPGSAKKSITLNVGGKSIKTTVEIEDAEAAKFVVDREYAILTLYANHDLWKEAWLRYYRMIYRDSYSRLNQVSADLYKNLFSKAVKSDSSNPEKAYAQELLTWTQNFTYSRDTKNSDFTDLISAVCQKGCDCDTRAMLLCSLMQHIGVKSTLFISREYSHAIAGFAVEGNGAKIAVDNTEYLLAETTAHVNIGLIAQDMSDTDKWIAVEFQ